MGWITILCAATIAIASILGSNFTSLSEKINLEQLQYVWRLAEDLPPPYTPIKIPPRKIGKEYDFIIVGAGSAGSVVANRLSEIASWKILLLEAGYPENNIAQYPILAPTLQLTDYNWAFSSEPQDNICLAMKEQRCAFPRGKALGGSSAINYLEYVRGHPDDYNRWAAQGNPGWSYEKVLPYFLKSEDADIPFSHPKYHSIGGYLSIQQSSVSEFGNAFLKAGQELGYPLTDYNSPQQTGFTILQKTTRFGRRASTATAYLQPILNRTNLDILTGARVTRILIDPYTNRAYGVEYNKNDKKFVVEANKEVILSAGALQSPQLLMLSGVGPKEELEKHEIKTLSNLPVGETFYEHILFWGLIFNTNLTQPSLAELFNYHEIERWYKTGQGPLSELFGSEVLAFLKSSNPNPEDGASPDFELILTSQTLASDSGAVGKRSLRISDEYYQEMYGPLVGMSTFGIVIMLTHPKSVGYLKLKSADPYDDPLIYGHFLSDPENYDMRIIIEAIRTALRLVDTEPFKKYDAKLNTKPILGCEHLEYNSDEYWYCTMQFISTPSFHPASTCKMGPISDLTAVVNNELKVYGVGNLRVIDASIMPFLPAAHTNGPTIMIGEVGSDMIKKDWGVI